MMTPATTVVAKIEKTTLRELLNEVQPEFTNPDARAMTLGKRVVSVQLLA